MRKTNVVLAALLVATTALAAGCASDNPYEDMEDNQLWHEAEGHVRAGANEEAIPYFDELVRRDEYNYAALFHRGVANERLGAVEDAHSDLDRAVEVSPGSPPARLYRANLSIKAGNLEAAERDLRELVRAGGELEDRDLIATHVMVGTIRQLQGRQGEALRQYQHAIGLGRRPGLWSLKHYRDALFNATGVAFEHNQDFDLAWEYYSEYVNVKQRLRVPVTPDDHFTLGRLAYLRADFDVAREHLSQAPQDQTNRFLAEFRDESFFDGGYH